MVGFILFSLIECWNLDYGSKVIEMFRRMYYEKGLEVYQIYPANGTVAKFLLPLPIHQGVTALVLISLSKLNSIIVELLRLHLLGRICHHALTGSSIPRIIHENSSCFILAI